MSVIDDVLRLAQARRELPSPSMRRALREASGLSLSEAGRACGVSKQAIWNWESGRRDPDEAHIFGYLVFLHAIQELG